MNYSNGRSILSGPLNVIVNRVSWSASVIHEDVLWVTRTHKVQLSERVHGSLEPTDTETTMGCANVPTLSKYLWVTILLEWIFQTRIGSFQFQLMGTGCRNPLLRYPPTSAFWNKLTTRAHHGKTFGSNAHILWKQVNTISQEFHHASDFDTTNTNRIDRYCLYWFGSSFFLIMINPVDKDWFCWWTLFPGCYTLW